jgi:hypothetical protein
MQTAAEAGRCFQHALRHDRSHTNQDPISRKVLNNALELVHPCFYTFLSLGSEVAALP